MAIFYNEGENKVRPGVYQRHENIGFNATISSQDGYCAIPIQAAWGPLGKVVRNIVSSDLTKNYGSGTYGAGYTVPAAAAMFDGGASVVYTYRLGTGGKKASKEIATGLTATAKYPGTMAISVAVIEKLGDSTTKKFQVYAGTTMVEEFSFAADGTAEGANLIAAAKNSKYVDVTGAAATVDVLPVASGALEGGENPTVTNDDYSNAFSAFEPYYYNTIALDVDDPDMTLSLMLQAYLANAFKLGKLGMAVVGDKATVDFETRCAHAKAFNDCKVVYLGGGWMSGTDSKDGVLAICYTAGVIASTPSNQGIVHTVINGATELCGEALTFAQYEDAINSGMLLPSMSNDGSIWYDSGINTLITPDEGTQDLGWKKIRRVKVRFEMIDRLDRTLAPKVGRVSAGTDGIADIVQSGQRVLDSMANSEGKLMRGALFMEDKSNPATGDSAWFIIQADDIDSLEKIYLQYQFRYSQNS
ncbi:MAG: phage tail sheath subtilisin-like domain-containing protein [Faecousia sp.]